MASETFVSAMMLITGVVAASILIVAVLPIIWNMVGTFSSASAATDKSMRTDFKIVTTYAKYLSSPPSPAGVNVTVWMKNIGTARIGKSEIESADVYVGKSDSFTRATRSTVSLFKPASSQWWYTIWDVGTTNNYWDPGETLQVDAFYPFSATWYSSYTTYFQFTLPSGVSRSEEFTAI